jgi:hypothetical protein
LAKKNRRRTSREPSDDYGPDFDCEQSEKVERPTYKTTVAYLIDQDEVNALLAASTSEHIDPIKVSTAIDYSTYTEEEVNAILACDYQPRKFKKKK